MNSKKDSLHMIFKSLMPLKRKSTYLFSFFYQMRFSILVALLFFIHCSFSQVKENSRITELDMQGHRGARGLYPENTLPAFKAAMDLKMTTLELDTVLTKDKQLIIHHDDNLNPEICKWSNGAKVEFLPVKNFTVAELKELDCGSLKNSRFPEQSLVPGTKLSTLKEFFQFVKDYERENKITKPFLFNIETKLNEKDYTKEEVLEYARVMVNTIEEAKVVKQTTVQSFVLEVLPEVKKMNPEIITSALFAPSKWEYLLLSSGFASPKTKIIERAKELKVEIISPYYEYVNAEFVRSCRESKIKVIPWTVND
ncbi:MAG TPA: glycerophosphodiester phosphodiesterase family protein, partial [Leptospiraceae bacterium]|nr:glycerophosphodiester phosphodiesterase family protein [Leptospiraceae bacterium]